MSCTPTYACPPPLYHSIDKNNLNVMSEATAIGRNGIWQRNISRGTDTINFSTPCMPIPSTLCHPYLPSLPVAPSITYQSCHLSCTILHYTTRHPSVCTWYARTNHSYSALFVPYVRAFVLSLTRVDLDLIFLSLRWLIYFKSIQWKLQSCSSSWLEGRKRNGSWG